MSHLEASAGALGALTLTSNSEEGGVVGDTCELERHVVSSEDSSSEEGGGESEGEGASCSASVVSGTSSYLHTEQGRSEVRQLVHHNLRRKQKELVRMTRPKKEIKRVAAGSQKRDKRAHKIKIKESLQSDFF